MIENAKDRGPDRSTVDETEAGTKPGGPEVGPPQERVDDETNTEDSKTTHRQE